MPCSDVVAQSQGLLNVAHATQFVWHRLGGSDSECENICEEEKRSESDVYGVHPLLTDPKWAPTLISLATNARKVGQTNWELLVSGVDKRYAAGKTNMSFVKNVLDLVPNPFDVSEDEESTPQDQADARAPRIVSESKYGDVDDASASKLSKSPFWRSYT